MKKPKTIGAAALKTASLATASALALAGGQAFAQDGEAAEEGEDQNVIIVTARAREETLLEVPLAISVVDQTQIQERGLQTTADLSAYTPGFDFQETGQGGSTGRENPNIRFRGVAVQNENPAARAGAVFYEGAFLAAGAGLVPLFDLQQVEVIKGPQNAFFGRNTFAGAVNFIPTEPGDELEGFAHVLYSPSDQDTYQFDGAISVPLTENLAARVGAYYRRAGADFSYRNGDPLGEEETLAFQGTMVFDTGSVRMKTSGYYVDASDTRSLVSLDFTNAPGECDLVYSGDIRDVATGSIIGNFSTDLSQSDRGTFCGTIPDYDANGFNVASVGNFTGNDVALDFFSGSIEYNQTLPPESAGFRIPNAPNGLGNEYYTWRANQSAEFDILNGHTVRGLVSYGESGSYRISDTLNGQQPDGQLRLAAFANFARDLVGEIRITSPDDKPFRYVFGFSHIGSKNRTTEFIAFAGLGGTLDDQPLTFTDLTSNAFFGSIDYDFTDELTLSLEGRYSWDKSTIVYNGPTLRDFGPGDMLPDITEDESQSLNRFAPRVLLSYQPNERLNIYASWALSYLLGNDTNIVEYSQVVPNSGLTVENIGLFTDPQKLNAYEIGVKGQPSDKLSFAVAGYYMDWANQVTFDLGPFFRPLFTAGDSKYVGIEAETNFTPVDWLQLNANFNYVDAEFTDFAGAGSVSTQILNPDLEPGTQISSNGGRPRYIPEWSGAFGARVDLGEIFQMDRSAFIRLDGTYFGDFFIDNFEYNEINGFWRFNARASVEVADGVRVDLYGLNLTDDLSFNSGGGTTTGNLGSTVPFATRTTFGTLPRAREIGMELRIDF